MMKHKILSVTLLAIAASAHGVESFAHSLEYQDSVFDTVDLPEVLTAVRLRQPATDVPASVTILDRDFIKNTGARDLPELLRYVPGVLVVPNPSDNSDSVIYHGGPSMHPRYMQFLIDGRALYRTSLSVASAYQAPVAVEDIERIEIVRGPDSTSYGSNAFHAVINIITLHASDVSGSQLTSMLGNNGYRYNHLRTSGGNDNSRWRASVTDKATDQLRDIYNPAEHCDPSCDDHRRVSFANLKWNYDLSAGESLTTDMVYMSSNGSLPGYQADTNKISEQHIDLGLTYDNSNIKAHNLRAAIYGTVYERRQFQNTDDMAVGFLDADLASLFQLNPAAANEIAAGVVPPPSLDYTDPEQVALIMALNQTYANPMDFMVPVTADLDSYNTAYRYDAEIQDTWAPTNALVLVNGVGYRYDRVDSEHFYGGVVDDHRYRAFSNATWRPVDKLSLHAGIMLEKEGETSAIYSHRAAANYLYTPLQSVRLVYSKAARTADFFEQYVNFRYKFTNIETEATTPYTDYFYATQTGPGAIPPQYIESFELGFHGSTDSSNHRTYWDVKIYREQMYDAIYKLSGLPYNVTYTDNQILFQGIEWELAYSPSRNTTLRMNTALTDVEHDLQEGMTPEVMLDVYAPFSQTLSWQQAWSNGLNTMLSYFMVHNLGAPDSDAKHSEIRRVDLNVYRDTRLFSLDAQWMLRVQHDFSADPYLADPQYRIDGEPYEHLTRVQGGLQVKF